MSLKNKEEYIHCYILFVVEFRNITQNHPLNLCLSIAHLNVQRE